MKIIPFLPLVAALLAAPAAAAGPSVWNSPPYAAEPPLVTSTPAEIRARLDEVTTFPTTLDPRLWDGQRLRPEVRSRVLAVAQDTLARIGIPDLAIEAIDLSGSTVSYEYDADSDVSVRIFLDTSRYTGDVAQLGALLTLYTDYLEAVYEGRILLHGVPAELQFYAQRSKRYEPEKGVGHYAVLTDSWLEPPVQQENRFDTAQMMADASGFVAQYNGLVTAYFADKAGFDCGRLGAFTKELRRYRGAAIDKDGIRSTGNLTYRLLRRLDVNVSENVRMLTRECQAVHWSLE